MVSEGVITITTAEGNILTANRYYFYAGFKVNKGVVWLGAEKVKELLAAGVLPPTNLYVTDLSSGLTLLAETKHLVPIAAELLGTVEKAPFVPVVGEWYGFSDSATGNQPPVYGKLRKIEEFNAFKFRDSQHVLWRKCLPISDELRTALIAANPD